MEVCVELRKRSCCEDKDNSEDVHLVRTSTAAYMLKSP